MSYFDVAEGEYQGDSVLKIDSDGQFDPFDHHIGSYAAQQPYQSTTTNPQQLIQTNPLSTHAASGIMQTGYLYIPNTTATRAQPARFNPQQHTLDQVQGIQASEFWNVESYFLGGEDIVWGTPSELWHPRPDARVSIVESFGIWQRERPNFGSDDSKFLQVDQQNEVRVGGTTQSVTKTQKKRPPTKKSNTQSTPKPQRERYMHLPDRPVAKAGDLAPYVPDPYLMSATACRDYLAYPDPGDIVRVPTIQNDDWRAVSNHRFHEFIGRIFDVLLHPYAPNPPAGIEMDEASKIEKYRKQQETATQNLGVLLGTTSGVRRAKAQCYLLVDTVIFFHQHGTSKCIWDGYRFYVETKKQIDRRYRLDLDSICSVRLEKIVDIVKSNKLICEDILEGRNFCRIVQDPTWYLGNKFILLKSNYARQQRTDNQNKREEEMKVKKKKGKKKTAGKKEIEAESEGETEGEVYEHSDDDIDMEDDSDGEYVPPKRSRAARS